MFRETIVNTSLAQMLVQFDGFDRLTPTVARVRLEKKFGLINTETGKILLNVCYDRITNATDTLLWVWNGKKSAVFNAETEKLSMEVVYDDVTPLTPTYTLVRQGEKYGLVDVVKGEFALDVEYDGIYAQDDISHSVYTLNLFDFVGWAGSKFVLQIAENDVVRFKVSKDKRQGIYDAKTKSFAIPIMYQRINGTTDRNLMKVVLEDERFMDLVDAGTGISVLGSPCNDIIELTGNQFGISQGAQLGLYSSVHKKLVWK